MLIAVVLVVGAQSMACSTKREPSGSQSGKRLPAETQWRSQSDRTVEFGRKRPCGVVVITAGGQPHACGGWRCGCKSAVGELALSCLIYRPSERRPEHLQKRPVHIVYACACRPHQDQPATHWCALRPLSVGVGPALS